MDGMGASSPASPVGVEDVMSSEPPHHPHTQPPPLTEEQLVRIEFYKTYDVMTGVRIAATLGGFFSMMILLVLYKNYCKPGKSLSEEKLNAAVSAAVEEEDRALAAALEATSFYSSLGKPRQSVGSGSQPRFSSPGGPVLRYPPDEDFDQQEGLEFEVEEDLDLEADCREDRAPDYYSCSYLSVPVDRRLSSVTCSSGDSSYLERRGSAFEVGLPAPPCCPRTEKRKLPTNEEPWDFYYPIDIQVIQPTPEMSPSGSEQTLYEEPGKLGVRGLQVPIKQDRMHRLTVDRSEIGLAPLASISSLGSFSSNSSPWLSGTRKPQKEVKDDIQDDSVGSDSVFADDLDTEDEVEEFETDSELEDGFDDDYSFCETTRRPVSRCEQQPRFASFDSCDMSLVEGFEEVDGQRSPRNLRRQLSDGGKPKKRLVKTYSEPRRTKQLPVWVERGRSGYVPRRQLSAPGSAKTKEVQPPAPPPLPQRPKLALPGSGSSSDSPTLTHQDERLSQGTSKDLPPGDKRGRFSKQKTIQEGSSNLMSDIAQEGSSILSLSSPRTEQEFRLEPPIHEGSSSLLLPPPIEISGSCEHLAEHIDLNPVVISLQQASRSSSQETLC